MGVEIADLMTANTITVNKHDTLGHLRSILRKNKINSLPVVDSENEPVGIVSASDLVQNISDSTPVSSVMTTKVYSIPKYADPQLAAKMMRNHKIHHLVVTQDKALVGIVSSFDLLQLVEGRRFVMKNASTAKKHNGKRVKAES